MRKQFLNLGKALSKTEQKSINGGGLTCCEWCSDGTCSEWTLGGRACSFAPPC